MRAEGTATPVNSPFEQLRINIHAGMEAVVAERIKNNPTPTEEELLIGAFKEMIEPQVQNAVIELCRKGYSTASSGFGGEHADIQCIDGYFTLDEKTKAKLEAMGVEVLKDIDVGLKFGKSAYTFIRFKPMSPDLNEIVKQWGVIVEMMPALGVPAEPSVNGSEFQSTYAPHRTDIEQKRIERMLTIQSMAPWKVQQLEDRLAEIKGTP